MSIVGVWNRVLLTIVALVLAAAGPASAAAPDLDLETIISGFSRPVVITHAGDGTSRLFVAGQAGVIRIWDGSQLLPTPFLDLSGVVSCCGEQGLLGLAFHPDYASNGYFFVDYTDFAGDTVVARYQVSADANVADPASAVVVLSQDQPASNHNGGHLVFGPDGYLYIGLGDGGGAGDPYGSGQSLETWLGTILRIDVDALPYTVPADNPFVGVFGALEEIWAWGLRNPWRFSFDRQLGDLLIADVGQYEWEEVDLQPAASAGGENYGWPRMEGDHCFSPPTNCNDGSLVLPVLEYAHSGGRCSITGGHRYRGYANPALRGMYLFGDYCTGEVMAATGDAGGGWSFTTLGNIGTSFALVSLGEGEDGELYVADLGGGGKVHRIFDNNAAGLVFFDGLDEGDSSRWSAVVGETQ